MHIQKYEQKLLNLSKIPLNIKWIIKLKYKIWVKVIGSAEPASKIMGAFDGKCFIIFSCFIGQFFEKHFLLKTSFFKIKKIIFLMQAEFPQVTFT